MTQGKKLLIINILDILKKYTDENHRLSQREIAEILASQYEMNVNRKTVKRNLMELIAFGYEIEYSESIRMVPNKKTGELEEVILLSDFYLVRDFSDSELRLLIDSLLFFRHIPYSQRRELIGKLESLSNIYFRSRIKYIHTPPNHAGNNRQLFYTIDILDEAISKGKQVCFLYNSMGTDKKLHPRTDSTGQIRKYIVNPYQLVTANGRYYLVGNYDKYDNVAHYRIDRISDIQLLDTPTKPHQKVRGLENGLRLPEHMAEHPYLFTGESVRVEFRAALHLLDDLFDWFGTDIRLSGITGVTVNVSVSVNEQAMFFWAMQYAPYVEVLSPPPLRRLIAQALSDAAEKYQKPQDASMHNGA